MIATRRVAAGVEQGLKVFAEERQFVFKLEILGEQCLIHLRVIGHTVALRLIIGGKRYFRGSVVGIDLLGLLIGGKSGIIVADHFIEVALQDSEIRLFGIGGDKFVDFGHGSDRVALGQKEAHLLQRQLRRLSLCRLKPIERGESLVESLRMPCRHPTVEAT